MSLKKHLKTYLSFSSSERRSLIVLLSILLGIFLFPLFIRDDNHSIWEQDLVGQKSLDSLLTVLTAGVINEKSGEESGVLFSFDPNQIDRSSLLSLGFSDYTIKNLFAYKKSGGRIESKVDLKKIYGMTDDLYCKLEPYIQIVPAKALVVPKLKVQLKIFDLNKVDELGLLALGFSAFQVRSILNYRAKFGPFKNKQEFKKVYGINLSDFKKYEKYIEVKSDSLKKETYLFSFNPNLISEEAWGSLGVKRNIANRVSLYLSKGARFRKASDLMKIYGFDSLKYLELKPYILIPKSSEVKVSLVNLNKADSAQLVALPGIGAYFSSQIIKYRKKIGGFYNVDQLLEVRGLRKSRVDSIRSYLFVDKIDLCFIDINKATVDELSQHPYISYREASDIVRLRKRKNTILDLEVLHEKRILSKSTYQRVKPYLVLK